MILGRKYLYQIGNGNGEYFVFPKENLSVVPNTSKKTVYEDNQQVVGNIDVFGTDGFKPTATTYKVDFVIQDKHFISIDYLKRVFWEGGETIAFWYDFDTQNDVRWYYGYVKVTQGIQDLDQSSLSPSNEGTSYSVELTNSTSLIYRCQDDVFYINKDLTSNSGVTYGDTLYVDVSHTGSTVYSGEFLNADINVNTLSIPNKKLYFDYERRYPIYTTDRYIKYTIPSIKSSGLLLDTTITTNDITDIYTNDVIRETSYKNQIYWIQIGSLQQNQSITIVNQDNNSGLTITWLNTISSTTLYYNNKAGRIYDLNGNIILISQAKIDRALNTNSFLYFDAENSLNNWLRYSNQQLRITKNTTSNLTLKIDILPTYKA